jgi:hypothetical protein
LLLRVRLLRLCAGVRLLRVRLLRLCTGVLLLRIHAGLLRIGLRRCLRLCLLAAATKDETESHQL